jgi:hypothetical protein
MKPFLVILAALSLSFEMGYLLHAHDHPSPTSGMGYLLKPGGELLIEGRSLKNDTHYSFRVLLDQNIKP